MPQLELGQSRYESWDAGAPGGAERRAATAAAPHPPYEIIGPPGAPVIAVLGGISATKHVTATESDATAGWWDVMVGPGQAIDTDRYRVLSFDYMDGGRGADGRPTRTVTTHDQADALAALLDALDVRRAHAVVGASYGGMVALAFGERYGERAERLVVIGAPHESHPMSTGLRAIQRRIVELGLETGRAGDALTLARALGMTTYRSAREFGARFDTAPTRQEGGDATFPVEEYLLHHGRKFADRFRPERFLALSLSADLHRVDPGRIHTPTLLVAAEGDTLVPGEQMEWLAAQLAGPTRLVHLASETGHDAFLTEPDRLDPVLRAAFTSPTL